MTKSPSPRPLSIKVIAIAEFFQAGLILCQLVAPQFISKLIEPLVGSRDLRVEGALAFGILLLFMGVGLYLGIGLWRLNVTVRRIEIVLVSLGLLRDSSVLVLILGLATFGMMPPLSQKIIGLSAVFIALPVVLDAAKLWFLVKRKSAFVKPAKSV